MSFGVRVPICFHCRFHDNLNPNPWPLYTDENLMDWTSKVDTAANYLAPQAAQPQVININIGSINLVQPMEAPRQQWNLNVVASVMQDSPTLSSIGLSNITLWDSFYLRMNKPCVGAVCIILWSHYCVSCAHVCVWYYAYSWQVSSIKDLMLRIILRIRCITMSGAMGQSVTGPHL